MIKREDIIMIAEAYDMKNISIAVLGSHSALEIMDGARDEDFKTICVCQKGRETPYLRYKRLVDKIILLDKFSDISFKENQEKMLEMNSIMIPHRALTAYVGYEIIQNELSIPLFGNRNLLRAEERTYQKNQYYLLEKAGIRHPKIYKDPSQIDALAMVKVQEANRNLERAFFLVSSTKDYYEKSQIKINRHTIEEKDLSSAVID